MNNLKKERSKKLRKVQKENKAIFRAYTKAKKRPVSPKDYLKEIENADNVLEVRGLQTSFYTDIGTVRAVDGVNIDIPFGKTVGIVGESGCGKSVTSMSILRLLQEPQGQIVGGSILYNRGDGTTGDLTKAPPKLLSSIRGKEISMIFQEPMTTLNPIMTIGKQLDEVIIYHNEEKLSKKEIAQKSVSALETVGVANAKGVYKMYPHELSGGMRQRVVIAMALMCNPKLVIADEPTTALDVTIQAQILELLAEIKDKMNMSIILITHDLGVVSEMCDYVAVMYAGRIVEYGTTHDVFKNSAHPYMHGLMRSRPTGEEVGNKLYAITGSVPNPIQLPDYCYFRNRCDQSIRACGGSYPPMYQLTDTHHVSCWRYMEKGGSS
jgi:peptide/nickel transport system ATP-binding protein